MLILTRRPGESILIGDDIRVTVFSSRSGQISLGITAPRTIEVDREEIRIEKEADRAAEQQASEAELIKGLYVLEFRSRQTGEPLLWMASTHSADRVLDKEPQALALFHAEVHGFPLDEFTVHAIWNPEMIHYHATHLEREQDATVYSALLAECQAYNPPTPFVVPRPRCAQAEALEGAA